MIFLKRGINMKSKGILLLVLIFLLLIVFVGCSEDNSTSNKLESSCSSDEVTKTNNNSKEYTKIDGYDIRYLLCILNSSLIKSYWL